MKARKGFWGNYSLSIILFVCFAVCWYLQTWSGWMEFQAEQKTHGEVARFLGDSGYIWNWLRTTFENWQSEFLQLLTFVVLTAYFIHKGSAESKDGDEEMKEIMLRVERRVIALEGNKHKA